MHVLQCAPLSLDAGVAVLALYPGLWMEDASPQGLMIRLSKYGTQQSAFSQPTRATMDLCNRLPRFKMEPKWYQSQWTQPFGCGIQLPVSARCSNASTAHKASFSAIMMEINFHQHCMMASSTYAIRLLVSTRFEGSMAIVLQALPGLQMEFNSRRHQGVMPSSREVSICKEHTDKASTVSWSYDGGRLASVPDYRIDILDPTTGQCILNSPIETRSFLQFDSTCSDLLHTGLGMFDVEVLKRASTSSNGSNYFGLSGDLSWITYDGTKILWLPPEQRLARLHALALSVTTVTIGCVSGIVEFYEFSAAYCGVIHGTK
ncbi:WD40 repeat-like protein [Penicillium crustosum]|uniref:WD40 repeat-like protein n=1 Tax=Penicillium crustosum TaxID=36656 RepID=UPI0023879264|nr:WD40 repeat-like protein [Penicillium crustosum]KAJ5409255.1 WD40 repeat-like protein [Penicillium crustosum]